PVLVGASRKTFVRKLAGESPDAIRQANIAIDAIAICNGASMVRVHEPGPARVAIAMAAAVSRATIS
ncbi:MAG TPA: dihydropteroate synthase, partial [Candidatus Binataceae bacterium]|nr:dihydropteroate synthase [Candidatus Binataceae bacterium]